jgi:hypothetical protein
MLAVREETLAREPRKSDFATFVLPTDPAVCPARLRFIVARHAVRPQLTYHETNELASEGNNRSEPDSGVDAGPPAHE